MIETIFSLNGLGLLSFEAIVNRDYPIVFANLYIFALLGLVVNLISDLTYTAALNRDYPVFFANVYIAGLVGLFVALISDLIYMFVDPRIDFESRNL